MSHGSETRRMRGGKLGVGGRRSRDGAGLGSSLRLTGEEGEKRASRLWNTYKGIGSQVAHDWFGGSKKPSPVYVMPKTKPIEQKKPESERAKLIRQTEAKGLLRTDYTSLINGRGNR